jgi:hypothetical protein
MNAWSHLPNAEHIDRIIELMKAHPEAWDAAYTAARTSRTLNAARTAALNAARTAAWNAAWNAARDAEWYAARAAAWDAAYSTAWTAARDSILALIAYDDAARYLEMSSYELKIWVVLSEEPAAVLLLPTVMAFERIREMKAA